MSWTEIPTVAPGDYWSADDHNTYLKDNIDFLAKNRPIFLPFTERLVISTTDSATVSATGGSFVTTDSGYPVGYARFAAGANQNIIWMIGLPNDFGSLVDLSFVWYVSAPSTDKWFIHLSNDGGFKEDIFTVDFDVSSSDYTAEYVRIHSVVDLSSCQLTSTDDFINLVLTHASGGNNADLYSAVLHYETSTT